MGRSVFRVGPILVSLVERQHERSHRQSAVAAARQRRGRRGRCHRRGDAGVGRGLCQGAVVGGRDGGQDGQGRGPRRPRSSVGWPGQPKFEAGAGLRAAWATTKSKGSSTGSSPPATTRRSSIFCGCCRGGTGWDCSGRSCREFGRQHSEVRGNVRVQVTTAARSARGGRQATWPRRCGPWSRASRSWKSRSIPN